jgi:hypothetical protein
MDIDKLTPAELVTLAAKRGLTRMIRGKPEKWVRGFLKENKEPKVEPVFEVPQPPIDVGALPWPELKKLAKQKGVNTFKKKRPEIEILLKTA